MHVKNGRGDKPRFQITKRPKGQGFVLKRKIRIMKKKKYICERHTFLKTGNYYDTRKGMNAKVLLQLGPRGIVRGGRMPLPNQRT